MHVQRLRFGQRAEGRNRSLESSIVGKQLLRHRISEQRVCFPVVRYKGDCSSQSSLLRLRLEITLDGGKAANRHPLGVQRLNSLRKKLLCRRLGRRVPRRRQLEDGILLRADSSDGVRLVLRLPVRRKINSQFQLRMEE